MPRSPGIALVILLTSLAFGASPALAACTTTYQGPLDGDWGTGPWSAGVPTTTSGACIPADLGTIHVSSGETANALSLTLGSPVRVDDGGVFAFGSGGSLESGTLIDAGYMTGKLTLHGGALTTVGYAVLQGTLDIQGGTLDPGGPGVVGSFYADSITEGAHGAIDLDLVSDGTFDTFRQDGHLNGVIRVHLLGGYAPAAGTRWTIGNTEGAWPAGKTTFSPATFVRAVDPNNGFVLALAPRATLSAPKRVVVDRVGDTFAATCGLAQGTVASCTVTARAKGGKVVATGTAAGPAVTLALTAKGLALAGAGTGVVATLTATVTSSDAGAYSATATTKVTVVRKRAVINFVSDILFKTGSYRISAAGLKELNRVGLLLVGARSLTCNGHTDNVGSPASNIVLGRRRAEAVCRVLGKYVHTVHSRTFGATKPVASNASASGRARNRRVEIQVVN